MKFSLPLLLLCTSLTVLTASISAKNLKKFKSKEALCSYLEEKKEAAEERMRQGYTVAQYNKLEAKRKYWKKQYVDHCF